MHMGKASLKLSFSQRYLACFNKISTQTMQLKHSIQMTIHIRNYEKDVS